MEIGKDQAADLYRKFMEQVFAAGVQTNSWQGCYAIAPSGELLAHLHIGDLRLGSDPEAIATMLEQAIGKWKSLPRRSRMLPYDPSTKLASIKRPEQFYPKDGLVLHEYSRDLPHEHPAEYDQESQWLKVPSSQWNQDFAWFRKAEASDFVPLRAEKGQKRDVPRQLVERIVCCHLTDYRLRGVGFSPSQVERARLTATITAVNGNTVSLRLEGESRAVKSAEPSDLAAQKAGFKYRGLETRMLGKATFNRFSGRFTQFDLIAVGTRWHNKEWHGESATPLFDPGPAPTGFLFTLAGNGPTERLEPDQFHKYGWKK